MTHTAIRELLGAYALDAVEEDEREAIDQHLPYCAECRTEVAAHQEVAGYLSAAWAPAPDGLWDRIAGSLEESPPAMGLGQVVPMPRRRRDIGFRIAAAVAIVASAVIGVLGAKLVDTDRELDQLAAVLQADELQRAADAAASNPDAVPVTLRSENGTVAADVVLLPDGTGYLVRTNLPPLSSDRTYQMWAVVGGGDRTVSVAVLGSSPDIAAFRAAGDVSALAITEEVTGGVVATEQDPTVVGAVPA